MVPPPAARSPPRSRPGLPPGPMCPGPGPGLALALSLARARSRLDQTQIRIPGRIRSPARVLGPGPGLPPRPLAPGPGLPLAPAL
jgi:hypothetical protein